jgi:Leucine-rich repeat (LRR) protein
MKKYDWILIASVAAYSYLFYHQNLGINFLVFTISLIVLLFFRNVKVYKNASWIVAAIGSLLSAFCVVYYGNGLSLITNIISLGILSAFSFNPKTSILTSLFFSLYSIGGSSVFIILDTIQRFQKKETITESKPFSIKLMLYIVPIFIALLFFFMYKASNPLFDNLTKKINLDFISAGWIFFTLGGFCLMYGFFYHKKIKIIADKDQLASNLLFAESSSENNSFASFLSIDNEKLSGIILLILLNSLLLIVNILDVNFLWFDGVLPKELSYSDFVHQGTGSLITSIIIAILIIMYYFRGGLNFYKGNKSLKLLAGLWIMQNAFMIISTAYRNNLYINEYSLTYKRIGVYVWLLLVLIGLMTTFVKILKAKSNWYLFRTNGWLFYGVLLFSCFINWDVMVTNFNINKSEQKHKPLDVYYLVSLSERNIPQLLTLNDSIKNEVNTEDFYDSLSESYRYDYVHINYKPTLHYKLYRFLDEMQKMEWQSICLEKNRVYNEISLLKQNIKEIDLQNYYLTSLKPLEIANNLQSLYFSNNNLNDLTELKMFPVLENLYLNYNRFDSIDFFPSMNNLKILSLSNNNIKDISPLKNVPNISFLDLSNNPLLDIGTLPALKKLTSISLNNNSISDYSPLLRLPALTEVNLAGSIINSKNRLPSLPDLLRLNLQSNQITRKDLVLFKTLRSFISLEYLDLSDNQLMDLYPLTDVDYKKMPVENGRVAPLCKQLKSLNISRNQLQTIYPLTVYSNLEELHLSGNLLNETNSISQLVNLKILSIDYCGINTLDFIKTLEKLEVLNISNNNIIDYSPLYKLKNLKQLTIGTVRKQVFEKLKKELPNTNIYANVIN